MKASNYFKSYCNLYLTGVPQCHTFILLNRNLIIMKYLEYLIWIFGILAGLLMLLGSIDFIFCADLIAVNHVVNYFHVANSFLLVCISCVLYLIWKNKKEG